MEKAYETYKDTQGLWIKKVPLSWQFGKFKHFADILSGYAFKSTDYVPKGGVPIIRIGDIKSKIEPNNAKRANPNNIEDLERFIIKYGDILLAMTGATIGKSATFETDELAYLNQRVGSVRAKNGNLQRYLKYFILTDFFEEFIRLECDGAAQENISSSDIAELEICFPSPQEQTQIATYLDYHTQLIDNLISKKETLIQKLQEQRQAIINESVTKGLNKDVTLKDSGIEWLGEIPEHWEVVKLKFLGESITGITYSPNDVYEKGTLVLRSSNIQKGKLDLQDTVYVNKKIADKYISQKGDILLCSRNGSRKLIGKNIILDEQVENETWGAFMTVYRSNYNDFIYYFFNSDIFSALSSLFLSSTINQLTIGVLNNMQIAFPKEKKEREQIVHYLKQETEETNTTIYKIQTSIQKLKEYRQSLISEAVTGKIDVRDWQQPKN